MTRMTIEEIHQVNLDILKFLHRYLTENGYRYYIGWGTLLGAVRHKGFIPWDDDSDILLPRPDYDRLIKEYKDTTKYRLYVPQRRNSGLAYARLCEMEETFFGQTTRWTKESPGVGVDIFPLDSVSDDYEIFLSDTKKLESMRYRSFGIRAETTPWRWRVTLSEGVVRSLKNLAHNILSIPASLTSWRRLYKHLDRMDELMTRKYPFGSTRHCGWAASIDGHGGEWCDAQWFGEPKLVDFCDTQLNAPSNYHQWLKRLYGDYMTPPPESERSGHSSCQTMYWRSR